MPRITFMQGPSLNPWNWRMLWAGQQRLAAHQASLLECVWRAAQAAAQHAIMAEARQETTKNGDHIFVILHLTPPGLAQHRLLAVPHEQTQVGSQRVPRLASSKPEGAPLSVSYLTRQPALAACMHLLCTATWQLAAHTHTHTFVSNKSVEQSLTQVPSVQAKVQLQLPFHSPCTQTSTVGNSSASRES